ncbi:hypothetical protein os1_43470 [Comamonadaceae bacterium OS-1]|nr:hypothetical protein os1_43470 [Comamonadaceae bacterium OS-1]
MKTDLPPFPRLGELYRVLANALDTRSSADAQHARNVDRLARDADFDYALLQLAAEQLLGQALRKYAGAELANAVVNSVRSLTEDYAGLVAAVPLDGLGREQALPILVEHWFVGAGAAFLLNARKSWDGPDLRCLLAPAIEPIAVVLDWLDSDLNGLGSQWVKALYPGSTGANRYMQNQLSRWRRGEHLPTLQSVNLVAKDMAARWPGKQKQVMNFKRWCVLALALRWFEREAAAWMPKGQTVRAWIDREILMNVPARDVGATLMAKVREAAQSQQALSKAGLALIESLKRSTPKAADAQAQTQQALVAFKQLLIACDPQGRCSYLLPWMQARWHVLCGNVVDALPHYEAAYDAALYRAGPNQKQIFEELLVVAAQCGSSKPVLKRTKHQAIALGFFKAPDGSVVEDWEVVYFKNQFANMFPFQGRFAGAAEVEGDGQLPFRWLNVDDVTALQPDLIKMDRVVGLKTVDEQKLRRPQLNLFANTGQADKVRQLLTAGASLDQLDVTGGSALLAAIQCFEATGDRSTMDILLAQPHRKETLDGVTAKKKLTPLLCAIECGASDVVARLLEMGASPHRRGMTDGVSPLYRCMNFVGWVWNPHRMELLSREKLQQAPDAHMADANRRYGVLVTGVYGDSPQLSEMANRSPENRAAFDAVTFAAFNKLKTTHTRQSLLTSIDALLKAGARPNDAHNHPIAGYTPLMLAAEGDAVEVVDLMLQFGGQPLQPDAAGRNSLHIAQYWQSEKVLHLFQQRGIT